MTHFTTFDPLLSNEAPKLAWIWTWVVGRTYRNANHAITVTGPPINLRWS